jgi:hypothetical protein
MEEVWVLLACGVLLTLSFLVMARVRSVLVFDTYPRADDVSLTVGARTTLRLEDVGLESEAIVRDVSWSAQVGDWRSTGPLPTATIRAVFDVFPSFDRSVVVIKTGNEEE